MEPLWAVMNSPFVISTLAALFVALLNWAYARKPWLSKYEGTLIAAVKYAEKTIPDGTPNKALARLDEALKYALRVIETRTGVPLSAVEVSAVVERLQVVHSEVEAKEGL
ncbi:MAG TPA: hypothetical protein VLI39_07605 [Sedimentisphaerales bacterium]|nr:hypothetical protein [Sedimentisphaerales bacterium]